jgi:hypothetical protein
VRTVPLTPHQPVPTLTSIDSPRKDPINSEATKTGEISAVGKIIEEAKQAFYLSASSEIKYKTFLIISFPGRPFNVMQHHT